MPRPPSWPSHLAFALAALSLFATPWMPAPALAAAVFWVGVALAYAGSDPPFAPLYPSRRGAIGFAGFRMKERDIERPYASPGYLAVLLILPVWIGPLGLAALDPASFPVAWMAGPMVALLLVALVLAYLRDRGSAAAASTLLRGVTAEVAEHAALRRTRYWFTLTTSGSSTYEVEDTDGRTHTATHERSATHTYAIAVDEGDPPELVFGDGPAEIDGKHLVWASELQALPKVPVCKIEGAKGDPRTMALRRFSGEAFAADLQSVEAGDEVLVAGQWDEDERRWSGSEAHPALLFASRSEAPEALLRRLLRRRRLLLGGIACAALVEVLLAVLA